MKKNILLVVILVVIMASFVACKRTEAVEPVASESVSSSEEVSEEPSEEVSEEISEEASEEEVVEIDLSKYSAEKGKNALDLVKAMSYDELKIAVWSGDKASAILSDGDSYVEEVEANTYMLVFYKPVQNVKVTNGEINKQMEDFNSIFLYKAGDVCELTCEVTYEDGTTETITVNITVFK